VDAINLSLILVVIDDFKHIIMHRDILWQLKEIAQHIHVTANTIEDMAIKLI